MSGTTKKGKQQSAKSTNKKEGFTAEEKAAMKARPRAEGQDGWRKRCARLDRRDVAAGPRHRQAAP
ncbi:MAG: hypothetical protein QOD52_1213 [Gaiellaceae bacterium]|jgi:hypothetical protein|nr:hypothetical protein [Gaiellaceae bacterium]